MDVTSLDADDKYQDVESYDGPGLRARFMKDTIPERGAEEVARVARVEAETVEALARICRSTVVEWVSVVGWQAGWTLI